MNTMETFISFWLVAILLGALVAAVLIMALRRSTGGDAAARDIDVYRDQLAEVDRDLARGVILPEEAGRVRLEISRRLLEADKTVRPQSRAKGSGDGYVGVALAIGILGGTFFLYGELGAPNYADVPLAGRLAAADDSRQNRASQAEVEATIPVATGVNTSAQHLALVDKLRTALVDRPDDLQGHLLLAQNEAQLGNFVAAYKALERTIAIKGNATSSADYANYADMQILAAGGYVSPEAEQALQQALQLDPENGVAQYYSGLMFAQNDRPDLAFRIWRELYDASSADAPWIGVIREQIELVAAEAGERYELPDLAALPGPSAEDVQAAQEMGVEDRAAMISNMVKGLSERLASDGGPPEEWARLIRAYGVLGETERAAAIWAEAQGVFAASPQAIDLIHDAAKSAGVVN